MSNTTRLGLPLLAAAQAQKHVTHNEALLALDAIVQLAVIDRDLSVPPALPAEGAAYIVGQDAVGLWTGKTGQVAAYQDGLWRFYPPQRGWIAYVMDEDASVTWTGTQWRAFGVTASEILSRLITVDGPGSGLDADILDGQQGSYYADIAARLGYTPANKAGETFTGGIFVPGLQSSGNIAIGTNTASAQAVVNGPAASNRYVGFATTGILRYALGVDTVAEGGSNSGANAYFGVYDDAGTWTGNAWSVNRATLQTTIPNINATGGVISGLTSLTTADLFVGSSTDLSPTITINGANGSARIMHARTASVLRWIFNFATATPETGANAGSNFAIDRCNDAGAYIDTPFNISRATGQVGIPNLNATGGTATLTSLTAADVTIGSATDTSPTLFIRGANGSSRSLQGFTGTSLRWLLELGNSSPETGSNTGSSLTINYFSDTGSYLGAAMVIERANGKVNIPFIGITGGMISGLSALQTAGATIGSNTQSTPTMIVNGLTGTEKRVILQTASINRWSYGANSATESGGDIGSDFFINRFADSGAYLGTPLSIARASGAVTVQNARITGGQISGTQIQLPSYTVATLPSAVSAGLIVYVSNGTANKRIATSDGTNWRFADGTIVS